MDKKKKNVKLYNVLFPLWMLLLFPQVWLIVLPGNFVIDSLVLIISMYALKLVDKKLFYKKYILKIFGYGMLSDVIGALYMLGLLALFDFDLLSNELLLTIPAVLITMALIFVFNYFVTFKKSEKLLRLKLSLIYALVTAPYTFLVPTMWLYG